ncbi:MAG: pyrroloquinoline quinone biosynthesis protein PqqE [Betaproteobacteria bacterium]|jgi:pyrroloquinoline quinone biosynthesis protein E|nr:pyrroloquinoline quinone biosynthesis protein PqqE [Methylophilaceae bacterium]NCV27315.1 pyrroloquinoline quinone biosynthesis protein PqqE [Nitrosomonadales bacterium]NCV37957.1 pyrroloquinoline quinone biosynthesis protein PqqE [Betaproteobacteria bacterium]NCV53931.1 pyrroloquinoline quinone biosynthesis protein PqqE [Betaproteobacteria bacterium]NCW62558.1 pyrroloquinoline quinone biosynthesis protein PqqE [Betaproteobacteria bacterium]
MTTLNNGVESNITQTQPLWLLAEITYRCPLHCAFCYNPTDYADHTKNELNTDEWIKVLRDARKMGALQLGISGGEPLLRDDIEDIVTEANQLGYYSNLITSGVGLTEKRIDAFKAGGLDHIQLSMHDITEEISNFVTDTKTFKLKQKVAAMIKDRGYPMVLNVVIHRYNIGHIKEILEMAEKLGADYVELANTQYYGWSLINRNQLMPTKEQIDEAEKITNEFREYIGNKMKIFFVVPDYYAERPKKCMNGWGEVFMIVTANGDVLPCHSARVLPNIDFPNVKNDQLNEIWYDSSAFNKYRGDDWMKEPCRSCSEKENDLGGCRCQAYLLSGDAEGADPICTKSPHRHLIDQALEDSKNEILQAQPIIFRTDKNSKELIQGEHKERLKDFKAMP